MLKNKYLNYSSDLKCSYNYSRYNSDNSDKNNNKNGNESFYVPTVDNENGQSTSSILKVNNNLENIIGHLSEKDEMIMNNINLKARLVEINNEEARKKNSTIMVILGASVAFFIFVFAIIGYQAGKISTNGMISIIIFGLIVFFILAISLNTYFVKEFKKISNKLEKEIIHKGDELNLQALEWVDENCDCDRVVKVSNTSNTSNNKYYDNETNKSKYKITPTDFANKTDLHETDLQETDLQELQTARHKLNDIINIL